MFKEKIVPILWLWATFIMLGCCVGTWLAKADPVDVVNAVRIDTYTVCYELSSQGVTESSLGSIGLALMEKWDLTPTESGQVITYSVTNTCPEFYNSVQHVVANYNARHANWKAA